VEMVEVKGHSNNYWNDRVDVLAKEGQAAPLLKVIKEIEDTMIAADWRILSVSS
ncbi:hypothetical protein C2G38_2093947, partial [Gigaspora rosea]